MWLSQHKDGEKNVDFYFKCLKFHLKLTRKKTTNGSQASQQVNESVNDLMFCVLLGHFTRGCADLFQDFPFSLPSICTLSFISKLNARSILKVKGYIAKSDAVLVAINKRINTNSNEASWCSKWEGIITRVIIWFLWYGLFHWIT